MATKTTTKAAEPKRPANAKHAEPAIEIRAAEKTANQNTETASFQIGKIDPAAATPAPAATLARMVEQIRQQQKEKLNGQFEYFIRRAGAEEIRFMIDVMLEWDQFSHTLRSPLDHETIIFSAIQTQISGKALVEVPDRDFIPEVEKFIAELENRSWKSKSYTFGKTETEITKGLKEQVKGELDMFLREAGQKSVLLMKSVLARWNDMWGDPDVRKAIDDDEITNLLSVVLQIEVENARIQSAVKAAVAEK